MVEGSPIPLGNITALNHEVWNGWMPPPRVRGTQDILYNSLVTISACVYTAIHPNIPRPGAKHQWFRRVLWVLTGIFAPEYVLYTAFEQFREARKLVKELNSLHTEKFGSPPEPRSADYASMMLPGMLRDNVMENLSRQPTDPWRVRIKQFFRQVQPVTEEVQEPPLRPNRRGSHPFANITYGFWVAMGGFRVDVSHIDEEGTKDLWLTPRGCAVLARLGVFLDLDPQVLQSRKKANTLVKLIVCAQVLWALLQCVARAISGLPLTLLEVHTFVHVVCAILMYLMWLKKPFDVSEAVTWTPNSAVANTVSCMYLCSKGEVYCRWREPTAGEDEHIIIRVRLFPPLWYSILKFLKNNGRQSPEISDIGVSAELIARSSSAQQQQASTLRWVPRGDDLNVLRLSIEDDVVLLVLQPRLEGHPKDGKRSNPIKAVASRWHLRLPVSSGIGRAIADMVAASSESIDQARYDSWDTFPHVGLLGTHSDDWSARFMESKPLLCLVCSMCAVYGIIHLVAWQFAFPTILEKWLWRCSGVVLATGLPVFGCMVWMLDRIPDEHRGRGFWTWISKIVLLAMMGCSVMLVYGFARIFLVVESFIQLRSVPVGVYAAVSLSLGPGSTQSYSLPVGAFVPFILLTITTQIPWADYIPHF